MYSNKRINLSNAVAIVAFDAMRNFGFPGCFDHEPESHKGKDFLDQFKNKRSQ
jgi:tRNA (cytidine/uridine-2'-O-)-methyltransferase